MKKILVLLISIFIIFSISGCNSNDEKVNHDILINKKVLTTNTTPNYLKFSHDGKYLLSTCTGCRYSSDDIYIWDVKKQNIYKTINRKQKGIGRGAKHFIFSPDGKYLLISPTDSNFRKKKPSFMIFDAKTFSHIKNIEYSENTNTAQNVFQFSPDGKYLLTDSLRGENIRMGGYIFFDTKTFKPVKYIKDILDPKTFAFSDDGKYFADVYHTWISYGDDYKEFCKVPRNFRFCKVVPLDIIKRTILSNKIFNIRVWNTETLELEQGIKDVGALSYLYFINDEKIIIGSSSMTSSVRAKYDKISDIYPIRIYNINSSKKIKEFDKQKSLVGKFVSNINNQKDIIFIIASYDEIIVWDMSLNKIKQTIKLGNESFFRKHIDISNDKKALAVASKNEIWLYDIKIPNTNQKTSTN